MAPAEWVLLAVLSVLWGGSFFFVEVALDDLPPLWVVFARVSLAAVALWLVIGVRRIPVPADPAIWRDLLVMGLLNNAIPFCLITFGQVHVTGGLAAILNATTPLFAVVLAHVLTADERLTPARAVGVVIGAGGVVLLVGPSALGGLGAHLGAQAAVLCAAFSYALAGLFGRRLRALSGAVAAAGMLTGGTLLLAPLLVFSPAPQVVPGAHALLAVAALALASTALAYLLYFRILARAGATNLLLVTFLIPVSAIALGVTVLGEALAWSAIAGMLAIFAGLACVDGRLLARRN